MKQPDMTPPPNGRFNLSAWALAHQPLVSFLMLLVLVAGALSYWRLPRNEDPDFTIKTAVVSAAWPGATVKETINLVTDPIERKLQEIPYLDYVESYTQAGESVVNVNLRDDTPPAEVPEIWRKVRNKMKDVVPSLPEGVGEPQVNDEFADTYGTIYGFTAEGFTSRELRDKVDDIRDELLTIPDISKVDVLGAEEEQIAIEVSTQKLAGLGINIQQIISELQKQNDVVPAGELRTRDERIALRVSGAFKSVEALRRVVLRLGDRFVPLTDIARIHKETAEPPVPTFRVNGVKGLGLAISMAPTGNMLVFGQQIRERMAQLTARLPYGIEVTRVADQSAVVKDAVGGFIRVLVEAVLIVLGVSFVSLGTRAGLVVAASIPLVLAMTLVGMELTGIGLQRISLGALIIALGLLVDDAMITVEAMVARLEQGSARSAAAVWAYDHTAYPMLTGTLVMIAGFIPVGFAASSAGEYCYSLFMVVLIALLCSWLVAVLFSPLLGIWLLPYTYRLAKIRERRLARWYQGGLALVLRHPLATLLLALLMLGLSVLGASRLESEFFPASDRPELLVSLTLPQHVAQAETERQVQRLENLLKTDPGIDHFSSYVGSGAIRFYLPMDVALNHENIAELVVVAKDVDERDALQRRLEKLVASEFPDLVIRVSSLELGPPVGWPLKYRITGPNVSKVRELSLQLASQLGLHPEVRDINLSAGEPERALHVELNQTEARAVGLNTETLAQALAAIFSGTPISALREGKHLINIVLRSTREERSDMATLRNWQIPLADGREVPLRQIATIDYTLEDPIVWRRQREAFISVQMDVAPGLRPATVSALLAAEVQAFRAKMPDDYQLEEGGVMAESDKGNASVYAVLPVTLMVMLVLLMIQLQRFSRMLLALLTAPFGLIGIVAAMLPTATPLGFVALLGIIALVGMIIRNAIILINEVDANSQAGCTPVAAIREAAMHRARPILLTASAAILGMWPISHQVFWGPMAYAIMGGLIAATLVTLTVLPAMLYWLMRYEKRRISQG